MDHPHNYPKLHNAVWPGLVGKGDGGEPPIALEQMLDFTAAAAVDGVGFDGFDIFLYHPHFNIDGGEEEIQRLAAPPARETSWWARWWRRCTPARAGARPWAATPIAGASSSRSASPARSPSAWGNWA